MRWPSSWNGPEGSGSSETVGNRGGAATFGPRFVLQCFFLGGGGFFGFCFCFFCFFGLFYGLSVDFGVGLVLVLRTSGVFFSFLAFLKGPWGLFLFLQK